MIAELQEYINVMKKIQEHILQFIEDEDNIEENFQNLNQKLKDQKILENRSFFKQFLRIVSSISNNHHRSPTFFNKIERILKHVRPKLEENFTKFDIFQFFKKNPRILLFLIEGKYITFTDDQIIYYVSEFPVRDFYLNFFSQEIVDAYPTFLMGGEYINELEEDKRQIGENESEICSIIRKDSLNDFINFVKKNKINLKKEIELSCYESNPFLIAETPSLIEYAAFFGSIQIFNYLYQNIVNLKSSIWIYAVHGNKIELIEFLLKENIEPEFDDYEDIFKEAVKCHHNEIAFYIKKNLMKNKKSDFFGLLNDDDYNEEEEEDFNEKDGFNYDDPDLIKYPYHYYNFYFFPKDFTNKYNFIYACKYDYYDIVCVFLKTFKIDLNEIYDVALNLKFFKWCIFKN